MGASGRAPSRIVGRDDLRRRIGAALGDPRGAGTAVLSGEAGIGKTVLARAAASDVKDAHILMGACLPFSTLSVPFLPLRAIVRGAGNGGSGAMGVDFDEAPAHVLARLDGWLDDAAGDGRVVLLIDDIQWADAATLDALLYLIADPLERPRSLILTCRTTDAADSGLVDRWLGNVRRMPRVALFDVGPLDRAATMEQMADLLGDSPHQGLVQDVWKHTRGHPYLTALTLSGISPHARSLPGRMPAELVHAVHDRVLSLDSETVGLLRLLAVGGRPLAPAQLQEVARAARPAAPLDIRTALRALDAAAAAGVVTCSDDETWWFRHPLTAEVLEQAMPEETKRSWHAAFLRARPATSVGLNTETAARLADHAAGSGDRDAAYHWALRAYRLAVAARDFDTAARFISRALALQPAGDGTAEQELRMRQIRALRSNGVDAALTAVDELLAQLGDGDSPLRAELAVQRVLLRTISQFGDPTAAELAEVRALTAHGGDTSARALALAYSALWSEDRTRSVGLAREALGIARRTRARAAEAWSLVALADETLRRGESRDATRIANEAVEVSLLSREAVAFNVAAGVVAEAAYGVGTAGHAQVLRHHRELSQGVFAHTYVAWLALLEAEDWFTVARWDRCEEVLRLAITGYPARAPDMLARAVWGRLAVRKGLLATADGHFARVEELATQASIRVPYEFATGQAEAALDRGEPWTAVTLLARSLPRTYAEDVDELHATVARVVADARRTGEVRAAGDLAVLESFAANAAVVPAAGDDLALARHALANAEHARGVDEDSARLWEAAADANARADRAWEEAYACRRAAECLLVHGRGDRAAAAPLLRRCLDISLRLGARPLEEALRELARFARIALPAPTSDAAESTALSSESAQRGEGASRPAVLDGLTRREAEIVQRIVDGLTYREIAERLFISEKTVSSHVSNILRKTGAVNRVDLARRAMP